MIETAPLPQGVRLLSNEEFDRLRARNPNIPRSPDHCITCRGRGTFRWWRDIDGVESVEEWKCNCFDQWALHIYLLYCGVGLTYQRLGRRDVETEPGALDKVNEYLANVEWYVNSGCGLILYGRMGTGKTLLSTLLLKAMVSLGYDSYFTTFAEMLDTFRSTYRSEDEKEWFYRRVKNASVLVLDDVGREHRPTRWITHEERKDRGQVSGVARDTTALAESTMDEVLRHRVASSLPTVLTTNMALEDLEASYGTNVMSLLHERSTTYRFTGEDFRDAARNRLHDEVEQGLTRPVVIA